jgi:protein-tyrosine-phosphatase
MKILFLCDGNAGRSQIAAEYTRALHSDWEVYSAGRSPCKEIHWKTRAIGWEIGLEFKDVPKHWKEYSNQEFDLVVAFSKQAYDEVKNRWQAIYISVDDPTPEGSRDQFAKTMNNIIDSLNYLYRINP